MRLIHLLQDHTLRAGLTGGAAAITDNAEEMAGMATTGDELSSSHMPNAKNNIWEVMT